MLSPNTTNVSQASKKISLQQETIRNKNNDLRSTIITSLLE